MLRRMATVLSVVVLAAACGDAGPDTEVDADAPALPGVDATPGNATAGLPPEDASVPTIEATLAQWSITLTPDSVPAGAVTIHVRNTGTMAHRLEVEGGGQEWVTNDIPAGDDVTMSLSLEAGQYEVYCPLEGGGQSHRARGMRTTLRVR